VTGAGPYTYSFDTANSADLTSTVIFPQSGPRGIDIQADNVTVQGFVVVGAPQPSINVGGTNAQVLGNIVTLGGQTGVTVRGTNGAL
ncbi:hypothetical protein ACXYUI_29785, partial [Klebsiella pneumoniae]